MQHVRENVKYDLAITAGSALANYVSTRGESMGKHFTHSIIQFLLVLSMVAFAMSFSNSLPVGATPVPSIFVAPEQSYAGLGLSFDVRLNVSDAVGVAGYGINMQFDKAILVVTGWQSGGFLESSGVSTIGVVAANHSDTGWVSLGSVLAGPCSANGNGTLAILNFKVIGNGTCALHIYDTQLTDQNNELIDHREADGSFITSLIPEFPSFLVQPILMIATLLAALAFSKKRTDSGKNTIRQLRKLILLKELPKRRCTQNRA